MIKHMGSELLEYFNGDELAASVWQSKYAWKGEKTPNDMHWRMAKEFARIEGKYIAIEAPKYSIKKTGWGEEISKYGKSRKDLTELGIFELFHKFKYVIPQGSVMAGLGTGILGSLSNCFVLGQPSDSYGGIFKKDQEIAQVEKRRGGVGVDISSLRPAGVATTNAAKSSTGAVSFMHRFSNTTREVAQNGRRGALMMSMDVNHPDILEFVKIKRDLTQVTGANISVKLNDKFMLAVEDDEDYILRFPCDEEHATEQFDDLIYDKLYPFMKGYVKRIKARELWNEIIKSAHNVAEPGILNWDHVVNYSPDSVYPQFKQEGTNPCSEIAMPAYDACRLIAVNLFSFVVNAYTTGSYFDYKKFYEVIYEATRLADDLIDLEIENIDKILSKIERDPEPDEEKMTEYNLWLQVREVALASRRIGLGFTGLADTLAALGLKYGSNPGIEEARNIARVKMEAELDCTIDMGILRGTFEGWDKRKEFITCNGKEMLGSNLFYEVMLEEYPEQAKRMRRFGRRNLSWSTVAPCGSLSILAKVSSGMEPVFLPFYKRRKKVNPSESPVKVDFMDKNGDCWQEFFVIHHEFRKWMHHEYGAPFTETGIGEGELKEWFKKSPWYGSTANDIDWIKRVEMQATLQKYVTHSISSTINLPKDVTEKEVSEIYMEAWRQGLKGVTVYREGSRDGVLLASNVSNGTFDYKDAPKRPKSLPAEVHFTSLKGAKFTVVVGLFDNKPYEVFITEEYLDVDKDNTITKKRKGLYETKEGVAITTFESEEVVAITRMISTALRHGADIKFIVEQLSKIEGDMFSFTKTISRTLKKYIPEGAKSTVTCTKCDSPNVIFEEGCSKCLDCGHSACS